MKYQSQGSDWDVARDPAIGWYCLKFELDQPQYYMVQLLGERHERRASDTFLATANGDLNGDGAIFSTFAIQGKIDSSMILNVAPNIAETQPEE